MDRETALRMARKLAQINGGNATEAEAQLAADHLSRIAKQHNLDRADWTDVKVEQHCKSEEADLFTDRRAELPDYLKLLINRICKSFTIEAVLCGRGKVDFIGDESHIVLVKFFMEELAKAIPGLRWKAKVASGVPGLNKAWKASWERGFVDAVGDHLDKIMSGLSEQESIRCRALALVSREVAQSEKARKYPKLGRGRLRYNGPINQDAYLHGRRDGERARLQANI